METNSVACSHLFVRSQIFNRYPSYEERTQLQIKTVGLEI